MLLYIIQWAEPWGQTHNYNNNYVYTSKKTQSKVQSTEESTGHKWVQYPLAAPSFSTTFGMTLCKWLMYLWHFSGVSVFQNSLMPAFRLSRLWGLYTLQRNAFILAHTFSIGLQSGLSGSVGHQFTECSASFSHVYLLQCLGHCHVGTCVCLGKLSWWMVANQFQECVHTL